MNIIFDMDGTLVDSAKIAILAFEKICPKFGLEIPDDDTIKRAIGYANPFFYYKIYPNEDKIKLKAFSKKIERFSRVQLKSFKNDILFHGVKNLLLALKAKGVRLYIASTGSKSHVNSCLKCGGVYDFFDEIHCGKPDKEMMVSKIVKEEDKSRWIMVGDKRKDSKAASFNGIYVVGAGYGYCFEEDYDDFDVIIESPLDILELQNVKRAID